ncbi:ABC transporter substrate-binding protein/permease [Carnobacterium gallinarum]|uniref:ABC transporter substrate-binding protein/permease n=1 Tax=Carnobacterium gallinarum TaxID=2749 RepID=UPI000553D33D|nr:ABC transporter substrate-binding protein/permease [Carnobacterium gallinarum]
MNRKQLIGIVMLLSIIVGFWGGASTAKAEDTSLADIKKSGQLVMGTSADYPPYEFHAKLDGKDQIVGMDVLIAEKIAKNLGVKLVIRDMDYDSLLSALEAKKVDLVIAGMNPTDERRKSVDFSDIYYQGGQFIIIRKEDKAVFKEKSDFEGKTLGVQKGTMQETVAKEQIKNVEMMGLAKIPDLILALNTKKIDGIVLEEPSALAYISNDKNLAYIDGKFELEENQQGSAIAFRKGSASLVSAVNDAIGEIKKQNLIPGYIKTAGEQLIEGQGGDTAGDVKPIFSFWEYFAKGTGYTILIAFVSVIFGIALGTLLALMRLSKSKLIRTFAGAYVEFVRGTPMMIQVMFIYFALGVVINIPALLAGIIAVSLNSGAYICEIIRSGLNSVSKGQTEAARSLGMGKTETMRFIIFPQALKNIWPALGNEFITVIKESSIVSIIGVGDLIYQTKVVTAITYRPVAPLAVTLIIYFILTFSLTKLLNYYEGKMNHD